ncbi:MAG: hypothetical protein JW810_06150 [Sedimentisphaerales bacterium]|nr:hypothetical protein [Sedimentisphaerales bacterium]
MQIMNWLLAAADDTSSQIQEIHQRLQEVPLWAFRFWLLPFLIAVVMILIWQRQKKIAENQVKLARLLDDLIEKTERK